MKLDYRDIARRITGISTPVFGLQWTPPGSDREKARAVVTYLEDRRILYAPSLCEHPEHCVESVLMMRAELTRVLQRVGPDSDLGTSLRLMRAACRKFLDDVHGEPEIILRGHRGGWPDWRLNQALGALRGAFGIHLARIAAAYGVDVEGDLTSILPGPDSPDIGDDEWRRPLPHERR